MNDDRTWTQAAIDFPAIRDWVVDGATRTEDLERELRAALALIGAAPTYVLEGRVTGMEVSGWADRNEPRVKLTFVLPQAIADLSTVTVPAEVARQFHIGQKCAINITPYEDEQ